VADPRASELARQLIAELSKSPPPPLAAPAGASAAEFARNQFGGPTRLRFRVVTVTTTALELLANNPKRLFWAAMNRSVNAGGIWFDNEITTTNSFLVGANGGLATMDVREDGEAVAYRVTAINDTASGTWVTLEVERV